MISDILIFSSLQISLLGPRYLMTPSYPKYYQPGAECVWSLLVPPHQRVIVRVLDLQLRSHVSSTRDTCQDRLSVGDTGPLCGELQTDVTVVSDTNKIRIRYHSGQSSLSQFARIIHASISRA